MKAKIKATLATISLIAAFIALIVFPHVAEWIGYILTGIFMLFVLTMGLREVWRGFYSVFGGDITLPKDDL